MQLKRAVAGCVNGIWGSEPDGTENDIVVIRVADFDRARLGLKDGEFTFRAISTRERHGRLLRRGDLLLEKSGGGEKTLVGQVVLFDRDFDAVTSNFVAKMTPGRGFDSGYLNYTFSALYSARLNYCSIKQNTGIQNLDSSSYLAEKWAFPSLSEQTQIAKFLDYETAKIDALIDKQRQLIALLNEKRQAVISHAVTKGLNPDAPMRDSGIEWLGKVPAHWKATTLKHHARVIDCKHITAEFVDDGIPVASIGEVKGWHVNLETAKMTTPRFHAALVEGDRGPRPNDIIFTRNATVGEAALVPAGLGKFAMGQDVCLIRYRESISPEFLLHFLKSSAVRSQLNLAMVGSTFKRVNVEQVRRLSMTLPPLTEQRSIVTHLRQILPTHDTLVVRATATIDLLQERRAALISAAVTGKIDVRNWKAPDMAPEAAAPAEAEVA